ncbi:MAG: hypothetical protein A2Y45_01430 [Tenericutes bacterium GWC2_34_14]|nr:MAG: hypothetical protein A2Z84_03570 [Tenericutes bacterium GWA2_35_7]OHE28201.1 MAG: hypothetical protein A2Y45_01430 [Tenericutes bacterium GWC2_34_14]OHE33173.1 MAG: hypothetical protein A2012_00650 [Tenericutes bacterium GWE2_34_108]OHE36293.1 MAG: hypothetical protein A2Y46_07640 [Tenericutes bacterium GWF1_35_14]OHE38665.1 MAG: hypothetical protein A2Y44_04590 [Tenericutes bacterium GWF2_35_184]OHE43960.1 MAG: hypothetical protein A3K26_04620 [Tenericutes bacterium RIFOXYA12_FULL_35_
MLKAEFVEMTKEETKNLWFISTLYKWRSIKLVESFLEEDMPKAHQVRSRIHNKYLKITCSDDQYIKVPYLRSERIQYLSSTDNNHLNSKYSVYYSKPKELYIKLDDNLSDMIDGGLIRRYYIHVITESNDKVEKYGISTILEYKNNGDIGNPNFAIEPSATVHKIGDTNILYNTIDLTFFALVLYQGIVWILNKKIDLSTMGYLEIAIVISYFAQLYFRVKYIGHTFVNMLGYYLKYLYYKLFTKKVVQFNKSHFTEKKFITEIIDNSRGK